MARRGARQNPARAAGRREGQPQRSAADPLLRNDRRDAALHLPARRVRPLDRRSGALHKLRGNVDRALRWIDDVADHDGDGFVDYESRSSKGLANQGLKDSGNAIANEDGSPVVPPVALVEVQGSVYRAKLDAAWLYRLTGADDRADQLEAAAADLRE